PPITLQAHRWPTNELGPHARLVMMARAPTMRSLRGRLEICSLSYQRQSKALAAGKSLEFKVTGAPRRWLQTRKHEPARPVDRRVRRIGNEGMCQHEPLGL